MKDAILFKELYDKMASIELPARRNGNPKSFVENGFIQILEQIDVCSVFLGESR